MGDEIVITTSIDPEEWDHFVDNHPEGNIFHTQSMAKVWNQTKKREALSLAAIDDTGKIIAVLQAVIIKEKIDFLGSFSARSVIHGGPLYLADSKGQKASTALIKEHDKICQKRALYSQIRNLCDTSSKIDLFKQLDYQYEEHLNFLIELKKSEEELWKQLKKSRRYGIRSAEKNNVIIEEVSDKSLIPTIYDIIRETYRIAKVPLADISLFESAFDILDHKGMMKIFLAKQNENYIGTIIILLYKGVAYDWYAAAYRKYLNAYPNDLLAWHAIKWCKENGFSTFDFGGAGKPDVPYGPREFKQQFGGESTNYGRYSKIYSPFKLKIAESGYELYKRVIGKC